MSNKVCERFSKEQLDAFEAMLESGIPTSVLQEMGIDRGSNEEQELMDTIFDIIQCCRAKYKGEGEYTAPDPTPDTNPGPNPVPTPDDLVFTPFAAGTTLVAGGSGAFNPQTLAELLAFLRGLASGAIRNLRRYFPLILLVTLIFGIGTQPRRPRRRILCVLLRSRKVNNNIRICMYRCEGGALHFVRITGQNTRCAWGMILEV